MLLTAERVVLGGRPLAGIGIRIGATGRIEGVGSLRTLGRPDRTLAGRVLLPGAVSAHAHSFRRLLRGRAQARGPAGDDFWGWRGGMHDLARALDPGAVFAAARHAFIEMLLSGVTAVGEFHYVHHRAGGRPYDDPSELADAVLEAARETGIRLCLLRALTMRRDFESPAAPSQRRLTDDSLEVAAERIGLLARRVAAFAEPRLSWGVAAHSLRTVPLEAVVGLKTRFASVPFHIHTSEQRREVHACVERYGHGPVEMLARGGVLDACTTLVHATHLLPGEASLVSELGAQVCVCPSTEADLGEGFSPVSELRELGVRLSLGNDDQRLASILEEARRLEMHERLRQERRNILAAPSGDTAVILHEIATSGGASALQLDCGRIAPGRWADLVSYGLDDPALAGADDDSLLAALLFSSDSRALRDVMVGGVFVVRDGRHPGAEQSGCALIATLRRIGR